MDSPREMSSRKYCVHRVFELCFSPVPCRGALKAELAKEVNVFCLQSKHTSIELVSSMFPQPTNLVGSLKLKLMRRNILFYTNVVY